MMLTAGSLMMHRCWKFPNWNGSQVISFQECTRDVWIGLQLQENEELHNIRVQFDSIVHSTFDMNR